MSGGKMELTKCGVHGCEYIGACQECYRIAADIAEEASAHNTLRARAEKRAERAEAENGALHHLLQQHDSHWHEVAHHIGAYGGYGGCDSHPIDKHGTAQCVVSAIKRFKSESEAENAALKRENEELRNAIDEMRFQSGLSPEVQDAMMKEPNWPILFLRQYRMRLNELRPSSSKAKQ